MKRGEGQFKRAGVDERERRESMKAHVCICMRMYVFVCMYILN